MARALYTVRLHALHEDADQGGILEFVGGRSSLEPQELRLRLFRAEALLLRAVSRKTAGETLKRLARLGVVHTVTSHLSGVSVSRFSGECLDALQIEQLKPWLADALRPSEQLLLVSPLSCGMRGLEYLSAGGLPAALARRAWAVLSSERLLLLARGAGGEPAGALWTIDLKGLDTRELAGGGVELRQRGGSCVLRDCGPQLRSALSALPGAGDGTRAQARAVCEHCVAERAERPLCSRCGERARGWWDRLLAGLVPGSTLLRQQRRGAALVAGAGSLLLLGGLVAWASTAAARGLPGALRVGFPILVWAAWCVCHALAEHLRLRDEQGGW